MFCMKISMKRFLLCYLVNAGKGYDLPLCFLILKKHERPSKSKILINYAILSVNFTKVVPSRILVEENCHCVKSVHIRSYSGPHFSRIRSEYGEIRSISPYSVG